MGIKNKNLKIKVGKLELNSPIIMSSGTFGYGIELKNFINYKKIGAIITKTITLYHWKGNPQPRIWETSYGVINSIGLQNPGVEQFIKEILPIIKEIDTKIIISISGTNIKEILQLTEIITKEKIDGIELNISCPNFKKGKTVVSQDPIITYKIVKEVKKIVGKIPLLVKLSPNVNDITEIALSAEKGGADILSMINTVTAIGMDLQEKKIIEGGLSGPAIKPIGLRCVYKTYKKVSIPIIGIGGITSGKDALEYILAGANAIGVGSGIFSNPLLVDEIYMFLEDYIKKNNLKSIKDIVGLMNEKTKEKNRTRE